MGKILDEILEEKNITSSIEHFADKRNSCGDDGVWLHDLGDYWERNGDSVSLEIKNGKYSPQIVHNKMIVTGNGKHRIISMMSSVDRMLLRAVTQVLSLYIDEKFSECSFAYRKGKGVEAAVELATQYIRQGKEYVVEIDICDFFDNICHERLIKELYKRVEDLELISFVEKFIACKIEYDYEIKQLSKGVLQGNPLSPLLSNVYMTSFDEWMEERNYSYVRYADNINIYVSNLREGYICLEEVKNKLLELELRVNDDKKGIFNVYSRKYLGYEFQKTETSILVRRHRKNAKNVYYNWHKSAIEKVDATYHIINDGILTKKDYTVLFENDEKRIFIPIDVTDTINVYSDIIFNSNFFKIMSQKGINVNLYDKYGIYQGSFHCGKQKNAMRILMKQVEIYSKESERLAYAKRMDIASVYNMRSNLKYYYKQKDDNELMQGIDYLTKEIVKMNESSSVNELLLEEGRCRQKYYQCFNVMIHSDEFVMNGRTKRPPRDEVNALISFGNTYLYQKIACMIYKTGVDIRISFVHSALKRYENLNLDIADIFKPIVVDKVVFTLINKKMLSSKVHFERRDEGVYLNNIGKKILLTELDNKMQQVITVNGIAFSYERLIFQEIKKLELDFLGEKRYKAYKHKL